MTKLRESEHRGDLRRGKEMCCRGTPASKVKRIAAASIVTSQPLTLKGAPLFLQMKIETLQQLLAAKARYRNFQKWADAAGVKAQTIWKWQRGTATPSVRLLKLVCAAVETGIAAESD